MTERSIEAASPPTEDSDTILPFIKMRRAKTKNEQRANAKLAPGTTSSRAKKQKQVTFDIAMSKALPVRRRQLGLAPGVPLERQEWVRLRNAVRKQCTRVHSDVFSKRLTVLEERVNELDSQIGPDPGVRAVRMLQLFHLQLDIARQQLLDLMNSSTALSEGCSHPAGKKKFFSSGQYDLEIRGPGLPPIFATIGPGKRMLCCPHCLKSRQDLIFETFGVENSCFTAGDPEASTTSISFRFLRYEKLPPGFSSELDPLLFQELWAAVLDHKFQR